MTDIMDEEPVVKTVDSPLPDLPELDDDEDLDSFFKKKTKKGKKKKKKKDKDGILFLHLHHNTLSTVIL